VAVVDHARGVDPGAELRAVAARLHPVAIFGIFEESEGGAADVWISDLMSNKTLVQRVEPDVREGSQAKTGSSVQAVRAVELLRASLLELVVERSNLAPTAAPAPRDSAIAETHVEVGGAPSRGVEFGFEAGVAALASLEGIGPAFSPIVRAVVQPMPEIGIRLSAAGLGTGSSLETPEGSALVTQDFGLIELTLTPNAEGAMRALFSIGAGAYHVRAQGSASLPFEASKQEVWTAVLDAGIGARASANRHFAISLEVHGLFSSTTPMVRIAGAEVGRAGRPTMLASLTLVATP
jgi:hypothetical protein